MKRAAVLVVLSGCAALLTEGPPKPVPPQGPIVCDTSSGAAGADIAIGTLGGLMLSTFVAALGSLGHHCAEDDPSCDSGASGRDWLRGLAVGGAFAAPWYVSAYVGFSRASDCRELKRMTGR